jgi:hypothetical protein
LPPLKQPAWTLLVQGVDLHHEGVHALLRQFRFLPDARLDDLMISYASDTGGVGAHFDSYDVFLLQVQGAASGPSASRPTCGCSRRAAEDPGKLRARANLRARTWRHAVPAAQVRP